MWPSRFTAQVFCQLFGAHGHVAVAVHVNVNVDVNVDVSVDGDGDGDVAVDARDSYSSASSTR